jgi:hypothetical protein
MLAGAHPAFDGAMILFQDVIKILHRSMAAVLLQNTVGLELHDGRWISVACRNLRRYMHRSSWAAAHQDYGFPWDLGRITAKAEIPPKNGSQINVLLGTAQVVICALNFDTNFLRAKTFINHSSICAPIKPLFFDRPTFFVPIAVIVVQTGATSAGSYYAQNVTRSGDGKWSSNAYRCAWLCRLQKSFP